MNNNDDFELNFDDDVFDMTDPNRAVPDNRNADIYGTYNGGQNDDIYGVYRPGASYNSQYAKSQAIAKSDDKVYAVVNILYYIALFSEVGIFAYFVLSKNYDLKLYMDMCMASGIFIEGVLLVDAFMTYSRYKRTSLIVTGIFCPAIYPFFRCSARMESKNLPVLWVLLSVVFGIMFVKDASVPMMLSTKGKDLYESRYESTMEKFKDYKYDSKTETEDILKLWFNEYSLDVTKEEVDYLYVQVKGQTNTQIQGVVNTDKNINPNTLLDFKVQKSDGSYMVMNLKLNNNVYNQYRDYMWKYWHTKYREPKLW